jgi:hypothetical protein
LHLRICAALTVALFFIPPDGFSGIELCLFKRTTDLPCPGCGLTRCGSNLFRGRFMRAAQYNPFGLVIIPFMAGLGVLALFPRRWRNWVRTAVTPHSAVLRRLFVASTIGFILFGLVRGISVCAGWWEFPALWP